MTKRRRFVIGLTMLGCTLATLYLLWIRDFPAFWTVLSGAAIIYLDRASKEEDKDGEK